MSLQHVFILFQLVNNIRYIFTNDMRLEETDWYIRIRNTQLMYETFNLNILRPFI